MGEERRAWLGGAPSQDAGPSDHAGQIASADRARELVAAARLVLVDFDGPLARLLPGDRWLEVAAEVRSRAGELGGASLEEALWAASSTTCSACAGPVSSLPRSPRR